MEGGSLKTRWTFCDRLLLISVYQCLLNTWGRWENSWITQWYYQRDKRRGRAVTLYM